MPKGKVGKYIYGEVIQRPRSLDTLPSLATMRNAGKRNQLKMTAENNPFRGMDTEHLTPNDVINAAMNWQKTKDRHSARRRYKRK